MSFQPSSYLQQLYDGIVGHFDLAEVQDLAFGCGVDWDELAGGGEVGEGAVFAAGVGAAGDGGIERPLLCNCRLEW